MTSPPDGLAPERTALAWNRTGLSLLGGALTLFALGPFPHLDDLVAVAVAVAGLFVIRGSRRPGPRLLAAVAASVSALAVAVLALILS